MIQMSRENIGDDKGSKNVKKERGSMANGNTYILQLSNTQL